MMTTIPWTEMSYETMSRLARMDHENNIVVFLALDTSVDAVLSETSGPPEGIVPLTQSTFDRIKARNRSV